MPVEDTGGTLLDLFRKYSPNTFPVSNYRIDYLDEETQDSHWDVASFARDLGEDARLTTGEIRNVCSSPIKFTRNNSYFSLFLDGCRRAYYICDLSSGSGSMLPIIAGQISAAIVLRSKETGRVKLFKHEKKGLILLPAGGNAINRDDASELKARIDQTFVKDRIFGELIEIRHPDKPKDDSLAHLNMEMQNLEIEFLDDLANTDSLNQDQMVIVDGALQFTRIRKERAGLLRYAVGLSKHFNLHLKNIVSKDREIGTLLIHLRKVGDRTVAFRLRLTSGIDYAFWYLRIRSLDYLTFPFAGIVKLEKALVSTKEKEDGLPSDMIDNISRCILLERTVCPYGLDFRWASHIYPIYLSEQVQKKKFTTDFFFKSILRRRVPQ